MELLYNRDAEKALLGAILISPDIITNVRSSIPPNAFGYDLYQKTYDAICALADANQEIDFVTVYDALATRGHITDDVPAGFLVDAVTTVPTSLNWPSYAEIVLRDATRRAYAQHANKLLQAAYDETKTTAELSQIAKPDINAATTANRLQPLRDPLNSVIDKLDYIARNPGTVTGYPTGYKMLDLMLAGLQPQDLTILAGRPAMGKTTLALNMALRMAENYNLRVGFFSLEMSDLQLIERLLAMKTGIDSTRLRIGKIYEDEWAQVVEAANQLDRTSLYINATVNHITAIHNAARLQQETTGLDVAFVDYIGLISAAGLVPARENRNTQIAYISSAMKQMARELKISLIVLSQLNRSVESRADKRPLMSDLRDSGAPEQDADQILFCYREDYYQEDSDRQNIMDVIVGKNRHGPTGTVSLYFRKELTRVDDLEFERTDLNY